MTSKPQKAFEARVLKTLFAALAEQGLRYAVLRNYENLPEGIGARDIDIVLHPDDLVRACGVVTRIVARLSLHFGNCYADERLTQFALVRRDDAGNLLQIKIDFFIRSEAYGVEVLSAEYMLTDTRQHNGIPVVSERVLVLDKWIFHLLVGQPLHPKYDQIFASIAQAQGQEIERILRRFLSRRRAQSLVAALAMGEGSKLPNIPRAERGHALARLWARQGTIALSRSLRFAGFRLRDGLRPNGIFISVSGPDGSGKTTVINLLLAQLGQIYGRNAINYRHFRPSLLPRIAEVARAAGAVETVDTNYDRPHRSPPSGLAGSLLRTAYYCFDYLFGFLRSVHPDLVKRKIVLYDRYYYDMIADPFRSRLSLPLSFLRAAGHFLPLPQHAFFLRVAPAEIYRRKQELTLEKIIELNARYEDLAKRDWMTLIDNNGAPKAAAALIVDHIVAAQDRKARRNLRMDK